MIFDIINNDPGFISSNFVENLFGTHPFMSCDNKESFENFLRSEPEDWYYRDNPVEYTINSHKFRTKEFKDIDWKNSIVLFGCSHVFGVGVTDEDTIAARLQKITGKYVVNLGSPGLSNGAIAYNSYYLKENYPEPLAVVNMWTTMSRWFRISEVKQLIAYTFSWKYNHGQFSYSVPETLNTEITNNIMYMKMSNALWKNHPNYIQTCLYDYLIDKSNSKVWGQNLKTRNANVNDAKPISIAQKIFPEAIQLNRSWVDDQSARDCNHWGREINQKIARMIASNIKL